MSISAIFFAISIPIFISLSISSSGSGPKRVPGGIRRCFRKGSGDITLTPAFSISLKTPFINDSGLRSFSVAISLKAVRSRFLSFNASLCSTFPKTAISLTPLFFSSFRNRPSFIGLIQITLSESSSTFLLVIPVIANVVTFIPFSCADLRNSRGSSPAPARSPSLLSCIVLYFV